MICPRNAESIPWLVGLLLLLAVGQVGAAELEVTGTDEHAWFLLPSPETAIEELPWVLSHHGLRDEAKVYRPLRRFSQKPSTMAALGGSLWVTLPPRAERPEIVPMRVFRVHWNDGIDRYLAEPRTGLDLLPNIETDPEHPGLPVDLVATSEGPVVLLEHAPGGYSMQRFRRGRWEAVDLPLGGGGGRRLGVADDRMVLLGEQDGVLSLQWESGEGWAPPVDHPDLGPLLTLAAVGNRLVVATRSDPGRISLAFVQPDGLARLGEWREPALSWRILGTRGRVLLVRDGDRLEASRVDLITGERGPWEPFTPGSPLGMSPWPLLLAFGASIVVLLVLIRGRSTTVVLPQGVLPLPAIPRLVALLIDAIPGLIVIMAWQNAKPRLLLDAFMLSLDARGWGLYATLVGITCAWSLLWELLMMTSPGKALMGGRLVRLDGKAPSRSRLVLRSVVKGLVMLMPILMITALRPPALQSPADQVVGLVVAGRANPPGGPQPSD